MVGLAGFIVGTVLFSPDLDLQNSIPTKNWGIFKLFWLGYHKLFRHRGKSHSLLFSSISKVIYLSLISIFLFFIFNFLKKMMSGYETEKAFLNSVKDLEEWIKNATQLGLTNKEYLIAIMIGISLSDWIHIFSDRISSFIKKMN